MVILYLLNFSVDVDSSESYSSDSCNKFHDLLARQLRHLELEVWGNMTDVTKNPTKEML